MVTMDCDGRWDGMGWGTVKRLHSTHRLESSTLTFWPVPMGWGEVGDCATSFLSLQLPPRPVFLMQPSLAGDWGIQNMEVMLIAFGIQNW